MDVLTNYEEPTPTLTAQKRRLPEDAQNENGAFSELKPPLLEAIRWLNWIKGVWDRSNEIHPHLLDESSIFAPGCCSETISWEGVSSQGST